MMTTSSTAADLQRRLDDLLEHLPAGVVVHGVDGRILHANRLACELLGSSLDELRGIESSAAAWHLVHADGTRMAPEDFPVNRVLHTGTPLSQLVLGAVVSQDPSVRWLLCNAYPEYDTESQLSRVVVCFTDCTALKEAEKSLQSSEERLQLALRGSTDAPWDYLLPTDQIYYSERWWTMLGYVPGDMDVSSNLWLDVTHPDDRDRVTSYLHELINGNRDTYSFEFRLRHRDGHYVPILSRGYISRDRDGMALRLSGTNTDLTERKLAEQHIYELANFDQLTGLPNRRLLLEVLDKALARARRSGRVGAVVFLDLDNFKLLNDTLGHDVGDVLLRQVAHRLRHTVRHSDQLARLGGDEFVLVMEDLSHEMSEAVIEARHILEKVQFSLRQPYHLGGRLFLSTSSMGATLFDGDAVDVETMLKQADLAMYSAKSEGRDNARFFDPCMQASADKQAALEQRLREGLAMRQFTSFYQPQFDCHGTLVGAEVLLRWRCTDNELLGPGDFIGLAESSGLIVPLGQHVLEESCRALVRWRADPVLSKLKLAVNVSAHQFRNDDFAKKLMEILAKTGAPADKLCLELTESVFAENVAWSIAQMQVLRKQGVHFSLDDFGTGYSSLAYMKRFPLTELKIDRSFIQDVDVNADAAAIVEAIIALANKLKLDIVAEGVEHEAQRRFLVDSGCGILQGYLLGQPLPLQEFERMYSHALPCQPS